MTWLERVQSVYDGKGDPGFGPVSVDVEAAEWHTAVQAAREQLGCHFFDWLTGVDQGDDGFRIVVHVAAPAVGSAESVVIRALVTREAPSVPCICDLYAGAGWHERETHEMFGIDFDGHDINGTLLLPDGFEGHPLRKDFILASRVAKPWPGAKEPGESDHGVSPSRRRTRPPGVPDPDEWGPHSGHQSADQ